MKPKKDKPAEPTAAPSTELITFEIIPAEVAKAITPVEKQSIEVGFFDYFKRAKEWADRTTGVTDPEQAKVLRAEGRSLRIEMDAQHKKLKEHSLLMGRAIDGAKNIGLAMIVPVEKELEAIEKAEELRRKKELADLKASRLEKLQPYMEADEPEMINIEMISERQFLNLLENRKLLAKTKARAKAEAEAALLLKEEQEHKERAEKDAEIERLRKKEAAHQAELDKVRLETEAKARKLADQQAQLRRAEEEKRQKELAEANAKADQERRLREKQQEESRQALLQSQRAEAQARESAERAERERQAAEAAKLAAEAEDLRKQQAAPDRDKLNNLAATIREVVAELSLSSTKGKSVEAEIKEYADKFAAWVEKKGSAL